MGIGCFSVVVVFNKGDNDNDVDLVGEAVVDCNGGDGVTGMAVCSVVFKISFILDFRLNLL